MKITLDTSDDKELRGQVRVLINEHLLTITREEIREAVAHTVESMCKPDALKELVRGYNVTDIIRQEARAAVTARLEQVFK